MKQVSVRIHAHSPLALGDSTVLTQSCGMGRLKSQKGGLVPANPTVDRPSIQFKSNSIPIAIVSIPFAFAGCSRKKKKKKKTFECSRIVITVRSCLPQSHRHRRHWHRLL
jgi:hypothetical protein